jgi:hypothetical protein
MGRTQTARWGALALVCLVLVGFGCRSPNGSGTVPPANPAGTAGQPKSVPLGAPNLDGIDPAFQPGIEALQRSLDSGADAEARAILDRLMLRRPRGKLLETLEAYRKIIDGRAVVAGLALRLELRPVTETPPKPVAESIPKDAHMAHLFLVAESRSGGGTGSPESAIDLEPGPATLFVTRSTVDKRGLEQDAVETHTFADLKSLRIEPGKPAEVSLARFFVSASADGLAARMRFEIDLRSGRARVGVAGSNAVRELPAMRLAVAEAEESALAPAIAALPAATPEDLAAAVEGKTVLDPVAALSIALRIPPTDRPRALDLLTPISETVPVSVLESLVPALRWIAVTAAPGGDGLAWRAWLQARGAKRKPANRERLVLPPARPE